MSEAELKAKTLETSVLEQQIKAADNRIAALSVESKQKRGLAQQAYIDAHRERFKDINPAHALIGLSATHEVKLFGAGYFITPPSGELTRVVDAFVIAPFIEVVSPIDSSRTREELGPVSPQEQQLVQWLVGLQPPSDAPGMPAGGAQRRDITKTTVPQKLKLLRTLPSPLIRRLAEECDVLETYLSIVMEHELGN